MDFDYNGALLINKHAGVSSFGIIEALQRGLIAQDPSGKTRKRDLPKMGHGGTLDPFATGLLIVCVGGGVKLTRYFLGSTKTYEGVIHFGQTTTPGDPTAEITERSSVIPGTLEAVQTEAIKFTLSPYPQIPPMHSAKKKDGKALYELAREGIEIEREPRICQIYSFEILSYVAPCASFRVSCSSGTYIRTLSQDLGRQMGSVAMLDSLHRTASGALNITRAMSVADILNSKTPWNQLPCWLPVSRLLDGYDRAEATRAEALCLLQGKQNILKNILSRTQKKTPEGSPYIAIFTEERLVAVACLTDGIWGLERVFPESFDSQAGLPLQSDSAPVNT